MDKLIIDGKEVYLLNKDTIEGKLSKYTKRNIVNENGDYACQNELMLEGLTLSILNKLNSSHFPKFLDLYQYKDNICLSTEPLKERYTGLLDKEKKNVIAFQILYALYESKVFEFNHNNLTLDNIYLEQVEEEQVKYVIEGYNYSMFNHGINVKFINFDKSRITVYKTYIFNELDRKDEDYDVVYNQTNDLRILDKLLDDEMLEKIQQLEKITIYSILSSLFDIPLKYLEDPVRTINEDKKVKGDEISSYIAHYPNSINNNFDNLDIFNHFIKNKYNRLLYKFLTLFPIKLDLFRINISLESYSKNRKIIHKLREIFNKKDETILMKQEKLSRKQLSNMKLSIREEGEIYDPILLKYYSKEEWLQDENNIILNIDNKKYGTNKLYFKDIPDNNILVEAVFDNDVLQYRKTLKSTKFINLNKYGINSIINLELFNKSINQRELNIIKSNKILTINYEYLLYNPKSYNKMIHNFTEEEHISLQNYTHQWDGSINGYLRSNLKNYLEDEDFLKYYNRFDDYPEEALENIKESIRNIDNAFLNTYISEEKFVVYRGTKDCVLYDELNRGYISTSKKFSVAYGFANKEGKGCTYEMHIAPGIPYIYLEDFTLVKGEQEILFPRNLIVTLKSKIGNKYIVDVTLSSKDQFKIENDYQEYYESKIEGYMIEKINNTRCLKNTFEDGIAIDEISGEEIDPNNSVDNDGMCYNKSTLIQLLENCIDENEEFVDPFTRIKFNNDIIKQLLDSNYSKSIYYYFENNKNFEIVKYLIKISKDKNSYLLIYVRNNFDMVKYLIENGVDIHYQNDQALISALYYKKFDMVKYLIENGADIHVQNDKALIDTSYNNNLEMVKYLIENGANIHGQDDQSLINASNYNFEMVKYLIKNGANIHAQDDQSLINASKYNFEMVKYLVEHGANIHAQDDQSLINASNYNFEMVKYLVERGANIHALDDRALINASKNNFEMVKYLIENGANIHGQDDQSLIYASKNNNFEMVKYLIENGANIHAKDDLSLIIASKNNFEMVKYLIENGADIHVQDDQSLINASKNNFEMVKYLIENGADIHGQDDQSLINASYNNLEMVKYLIENGANIHGQDDQSLIHASDYNNSEVVKYLIENGANIHAKDDKALINASYNNFEMVKYLIEHGANIHAQDDQSLISASNNSNFEMIKYLIENGANIHAKDDKALIYASSNNLEMVKYLIGYGANIHAQDNEALINASSRNNLEMVKYLVEHGVDIHARDDEALINASARNNLEMVKYLIEHGANIHARDDQLLINASARNNLEMIKYLTNIINLLH